MVTIKKICKKYTQKEVRRESKWHTIKKNTKESSNIGNEKQKGMRHTENKQQNGKSYSLSVITLNGNGLNSPVKRQRLAEWIKKT